MRNFLTQLYYMGGGVMLILTALKYVYMHLRDHDNAMKAVEDLTRVHLPYIYHTQALIARKLGIEIGEPPVTGYTHQA